MENETIDKIIEGKSAEDLEKGMKILKEMESIYLQDADALAFFYKINRYNSNETEIFKKFIKDKNLYNYCLQLLYILNNNRGIAGSGIAINELTRLLRLNYDCSLDIDYVLNKKCPYKDGDCDMQCDPSTHLNCTMNDPDEYLSKSSEDFKKEIINEINKKDIGYIYENPLQKSMMKDYEDYYKAICDNAWKDEDNYYGNDDEDWSGAGNYWGKFGEFRFIRLWDDKKNATYADGQYPYGDFSGEIKERNGREIIAKICGYANEQRSYEKTGEHIKLPSYVRGIPIKIIGKHAFLSVRIKTISLPKQLQIIEDAAFCGSKLRKIYLPESLEELGFAAFEKNNFTEIFIPKNVKIIKMDAFNDNPLEKIIIPSDIDVSGHGRNSSWSAFCSDYLNNNKKGGIYVYDGNSWIWQEEYKG